MPPTIELQSIYYLFAIAAGIIAACWAMYLYIERRIESVRSASAVALAEHEKDNQGQIDRLHTEIDAARAEAAKRDDIIRVETSLSSIHARIDDVMKFLMGQKPS